MSTVLEQLRRAVLLGYGAGMTDGQLLEGFIVRQEEAAFEVLVRRHGPMVLGVCRRVLRHVHDAEDAFQATFLVLARKAASIRQPERLGNWLYGVAYRTALEAKAARARRWAKEGQVRDMGLKAKPAADAWPELPALLDQELSRLPDKYREPIVLCCLEGRTRRQAARHLQIPEGTLSSRLAAARQRLTRRLARHGVAFSGAALAGAFAGGAARAAVPRVLILATVRAAAQAAVGGLAASAVSGEVAAITEGVLKAMFLKKLTFSATLLAILGMVGLGLTGFPREAAGEKPAPAGQKAEAKPAPQPERKPKPDSEAVLGTWKITSMVINGDELPNTDPRVKDGRVEITADAIRVWVKDRLEGPVRYEIDPTRKPKTIDIKGDDGQVVLRGIYLLEGDNLKLCLPVRGGDQAQRPTELASKPDSGLILATHTREKAGKRPPPKAEALNEERVKRRAGAKNMGTITRAMLAYYDEHGRYPPPAIYDENGKPLLSWRVALLPYLQEDNLYNQFKLNQPWDSAENKKLLAQMPLAYGPEGTETFYQVFTGKGTVFDGPDGVKREDITHGTDRTVLLVEAGKAVPWTKPEDLVYDPGKPLPKLGGGLFKDGFHLANAGGAVRFVKMKFNEKLMRAMIPRDGTESIDWLDLDK